VSSRACENNPRDADGPAESVQRAVEGRLQIVVLVILFVGDRQCENYGETHCRVERPARVHLPGAHSSFLQQFRIAHQVAETHSDEERRRPHWRVAVQVQPVLQVTRTTAKKIIFLK
jgi:hypothetical protein